MDKMGNYYIAYGSNMDVGQMAYRCPNAVLIGTGMVEGYKLIFKGSKTGAYATIEPEAGGRVPVLVWQLGHGDEDRLDRYEGYPIFYHKDEIKIAINDMDRTLNAMVYIMDENRILGEPSAQYYQVIDQAYDRFGFEKEILKRAYAESTGLEAE